LVQAMPPSHTPPLASKVDNRLSLFTAGPHSNSGIWLIWPVFMAVLAGPNNVPLELKKPNPVEGTPPVKVIDVGEVPWGTR
jgi:hypothetical protein